MLATYILVGCALNINTSVGYLTNAVGTRLGTALGEIIGFKIGGAVFEHGWRMVGENSILNWWSPKNSGSSEFARDTYQVKDSVPIQQGVNMGMTKNSSTAPYPMQWAMVGLEVAKTALPWVAYLLR